MSSKLSLKLKQIVRAVFSALTICYVAFSVTTLSAANVYFYIESSTYSDTVTVDSALNEWKGKDFDRGERQWTWNWFELGVEFDHFSIGYLYREDYDLRFSADMAELYWLSSNKLPLQPDRIFQLELNAAHYQARGIRLGWNDKFTFLHNALFRYRLAASYLKAEDLIEGYLSGNALATSENEYEFNANLFYHYSEDRLFDRVVDEPKGEGYSIDAQFELLIAQHELFVDIKDIKAEIVWRDAPYTEGVTSSDNREYDSDGYVVVLPTLSGYEGVSERYRQTLPNRWFAEYRYEFSLGFNAGLLAKSQFSDRYEGVSVGLGGLQVDYWLEMEVWQLTWNKSGFIFSLGSDAFSTNEMKSLYLNIGYNN